MGTIFYLLLTALENFISLVDKEAVIVGYGTRKIFDH